MLLYPITVTGHRNNYNNNHMMIAIPSNPGIGRELSLAIPGLLGERPHRAPPRVGKKPHPCLQKVSEWIGMLILLTANKCCVYDTSSKTL